VCHDAPPLQLRTQLCVVVHALEKDKTTNTGIVAARLVQGSSVLTHGVRYRDEAGGWHHTVAEQPDFAGRRPLVLFPTADAEVLTPEHAAGDPVTLVIPDGTWTQSRRMHTRIPWMFGLPHVTLPPLDRKSGYKLRISDREQRVSTMEAIAIALGILESAEAEQTVLHIFDLLVRRTMAARGLPIA
jgi:DTW domain-containing protein YfiP